MGTSTDAVLAFGYDLGSSDDDLKVKEWDADYGRLDVEWMRGVDETEFAERAEARLKVNGVTDVKIEIYQSCEVPAYMLVIAEETVVVARGEVWPVRPTDLISPVEWHDALVRALRVLGVTPTQEEPAWLLASIWC